MKTLFVLKKNLELLKKFDDELPKVLKKPLVFSALIDFEWGEELLKLLLHHAGINKCRCVFALLRYAKLIRQGEKMKDFSIRNPGEVPKLVFSIREQVRVAQLLAEASIVKSYVKKGKAIAPELCILERRFSKRWSALNLKERTKRMDDLKKAIPGAQNVTFKLTDGNDLFNEPSKQVDFRKVLEGTN